MIRALTVGDAEAVTACFAAAYQAPWSLDAVRATLESPTNLGWGYVAGQGVNAFILFQTTSPDADMLMLATCPSVRRSGLALQLWRTAESYFLNRQFEYVYLEVAENNRPALVFYRLVGFTNLGVRRNYYPTPVGRIGAITMRYELRGGRND